jgi:hypothetical protein
MGGIGNFNRDSRTLYIGSIQVWKGRGDRDSKGDDDREEKRFNPPEEILARHFGEWGELEDVSVKPKHGCAFIRYTHRINAEFAKVAMSDQELDSGEQLNVRWAHDDPNPVAINRVKTEVENKLFDHLEKGGFLDGHLLPPQLRDPATMGGDDPAAVLAIAAPEKELSPDEKLQLEIHGMLSINQSTSLHIVAL